MTLADLTERNRLVAELPEAVRRELEPITAMVES